MGLVRHIPSQWEMFTKRTDHDLNHPSHNLLLLDADAVQDLYTTDPTQETHPRPRRLYGSHRGNMSRIIQLRTLSICPERSTSPSGNRSYRSSISEAWNCSQQLRSCIFSPQNPKKNPPREEEKEKVSCRRRQCGGRAPGKFSLLCVHCGVEDTPRWVGTSGLHRRTE